jgi:lipoyl-dependent peroxiredoxin subunit D
MTTPITSVAALKEQLPEWARDIKLNLSVLTTQGELSPQQIWGSALASAIASRNPDVIRAIAADAAPHLDEAALKAAKAAAAVMSMNNIYYRFLHMVEEPSYATLPARLRMQVIGNPGVPHLDFELWSLAVSAINGCGTCVKSHERVVREKGASQAMVQDAVRIAAIVHAAAVSLEGEQVLRSALG